MFRQVTSSALKKVSFTKYAVPTWNLNENHLSKTFFFEDSSQAHSFLQRVAIVAIQFKLRPEWHVHHNKVQIKLHARDQNGLTENDADLAREMDNQSGIVRFNFPASK
jgi:4a-hydroxytetrahydrobiopterin dehydratase